MDYPIIKLNWSYKVARILKENSLILTLIITAITGLSVWVFYLSNDKTSVHYVDNKIASVVEVNSSEHKAIRGTLKQSIDNVNKSIEGMATMQQEIRSDIKDLLKKK